MAGRTPGGIQRQGLRAAGEIVDRLVAAVDGADDGKGAVENGPFADDGDGAAGNGPFAGGRPPVAPGAAELDGLVDLWGDLAKQMLRSMTSLAGRVDGSAAAATTDVEPASGPAAPPDAAPTQPGDEATAWPGPDGSNRRPSASMPPVAPSADPDHPVEQTLRDTGRLVRRAMLDAIPDGEPHDWLYRQVRSYPSRAGKAIRPGLCLATCRAFGGSDADALPVAVAIELLHNAFLIHDDIADGSRRRRGRPTLAAEYGPALALNAGDALAIVANQVLRRHLLSFPDQLADRVFTEFETMALRTLEGQATELGWRRDNVGGLTPEDYLGMIMHKTCWYTTIHPLRVGALIGSRGRADLRRMVRFGFHLGAAFQIRDDLLNLVGDETVYGKEINGDIYEGKRTLMLIHLLAEARGSDRITIEAYLRMSRIERGEDVVAEIRRLMDAYGSLQFAAEYADGIASAALDAFDAAFTLARPGADTEFVRSLVPYMVGRRS